MPGQTKMKYASDYYSQLNEGLDAIREGEISPQSLNATCNGISKVIGIARTQMEYSRRIGQRLPPIEWLEEPPIVTTDKKAK